jgi:hypothetical protein
VRTRLILSSLFALAGACSNDTASGGAGAVGGSGGEAGTGAGAAGGGGALPTCGDTSGELAAGLETLAWDDGVPGSDLRSEGFAITVDGKTFELNEEPVFEAVRFDLPAPTRVHGFSVHVAAAPPDPLAELRVGLYADFGHNGFDFWAPSPLFEGARCVGDIDAEGWLTFALAEPVEITEPGLVFVAHRAEPGSCVFSFDASEAPDPTCASFDSCHSALNLPDALPINYFNGVSFPFQQDYLVRLHVEPFDAPDPSESVFIGRASEPHSRASFGDYDGDGDDDLFTDGPKLFQNDGAGNFTDVTIAAGLVGVVASGGVFGDYDNDGCLDLFVFAESYSAPDTLFRNDCAGGFVDVTAASGIVDVQTYETCNDPANTRSPTPAAAWADLDADGFLDLYLANFICWDKGSTYVDEVWHNQGDGTFESWTSQHGFTTLKRATRGVNPSDLDGDGDIDLFVNNYRLQANQLFVNDGLGTFSELAGDLGVAGVETDGWYGHTIGSAIGDLDGDGDLDIVAANLAHPRFFDFSNKTEVLLQGADGTFEDRQGAWPLDGAPPRGGAGLRYQETHSVPGLADFDLDGALDLVLTAVYDGRPTDFYWGVGDGTFTADALHAGITTRNGWGVAVSDVDQDGDPDLYATTLFENRGAPKAHYLQARVVGNVDSNRAGIGATVTVTTASATHVSFVSGGNGQGNQSSQTLTFGLGAADTIDAIQVRFPGGKIVDYLGPLPADVRVWLYEDGALLTGASHPP